MNSFLKHTFLLIFIFYASLVRAQISPMQMEKLEHVLNLINMFYVDSLNDNDVVEKTIVSLLKELDPHSIYISKDEVREMNESLIGSFNGVGITYNLYKDTIYVIRTVPDGPSFKAGLKAGDRIVRIDDELVAGVNISVDEIKKLLQGEKGTVVKVDVLRKGNEELLELYVERAKIPIKSIPAAYEIEDEIAYIKLESFSATTTQEFEKLTRKFIKNGVHNIILDLRNNGGGYLSTAIKLIDEFMPSDRLIIYTKGKSNPRYDYFSSGKGRFKRTKLVILINENSASASEIVAGAIQDWDRGLIVGRRSFGKGLVQRPFNLPDGSMIRLTVARYYTPTGRLIQKTYANGYDNYVKEEAERLNHGEFFIKDSIYYVDSLKYFTLNQKRTVYGGGGIIPDIFVAADTNRFPKFYVKMLYAGKIKDFVIGYIDNNRNMLQAKYENFDAFDQNFEVNEDLLKPILKYAQESGLIDTLSAEYKKYKAVGGTEFTNFIFEGKAEIMKHHLKALIARDIWDEQSFYKIYNKKDDFIIKAISVLKNKHLYNSLLANSSF